MKKIFSLLLSLTVFYGAFGQEFVLDSTRFISAVLERGILTSDKGMVLTGSVYKKISGLISSFPLDTISGDLLIVKIDSSKRISWLKSYGGSGIEGGTSICATPDGGYAILANTESNDGNVTGLKGSNDLWLLRVDSEGNLLWQKTYGSAGSEVPISLSYTPDGGFILLGASNWSGGDVPLHYGNQFSMDWLVIKVAENGQIIWSKTIGGAGDENGYGKIVSVGENYLIASSTLSKDHDCTDTSWHIGVNTKSDFYLIKLDANGKVIWNKSYGGTGYDDLKCAMFDSRDSSIVLIGATSSNDYMVVGNQGKSDAWVAKVNMHGDLSWQTTIGTKNDENAVAICEGPGDGYLIYGSTFEGPIGGMDAWISVVERVGTEKSRKFFGGGASDVPRAIVRFENSVVALGYCSLPPFTEGETSGESKNAASYISYLACKRTEKDSEKVSINRLVVRPNPANNHITIDIPGNRSGDLTIVNTKGQLVFVRHEPLYVRSIDITTWEWPKGEYLARWIGTDKTAFYAKILIK